MQHKRKFRIDIKRQINQLHFENTNNQFE